MTQTSGRPRTSSHRRPSGGGRPSGGPRRSGSSRPSSPSPLEAALTAAAESPAPEARPFAEFDLPAPLVKALVGRGMEQPFAIQTRVLPDALVGRDVLGRAQTGSGKTLAFGIPVLARLQASTTVRKPMTPRALILVPTRELARQVADALTPLAHALDQRVTTVVGGLSMSRQIDALRRGVDVVVATPGRLIDLMERNSCQLGSIEITVIDEADHMADLGFLPAVRQILDATPNGGQRLLLSATLDGGVDKLVRDYLTDPAFHAVAQTTDAATAMDHKVFTLRGEDKVAVASEIAVRPARTLFFVRTKHGADRLAKQLSRAGAEAAAIHGNLNQNQRQRALDAFAAGHPRVLVATDVAARGIHVDDIELVVHVDPPAEHKAYLHRSGRTARAGSDGVVVTVMLPEQAGDVKTLTRQAKINVTPVRVGPGSPVISGLVGEVADIVKPTAPPVSVPQGGGNRGGDVAGGGARRGAGRGRRGREGAGAKGGQGGQGGGAGAGAGQGRSGGGGRGAGAGSRSSGSSRPAQGGSTVMYSSTSGGRSGAVDMSRGTDAGRRRSR